ncbi:MAG: penicillin-binding protein 2 [Clostridia bacterium]|nr:penicillin-binding protein 2 [Clostridia bacterium]
MRRIRGAIRAISVLLLAAFAGLILYVGYSVYTSSSRWLTSGYNARLTHAKRTVRMGNITDRNGLLLATTDQDGMRMYSADPALRRAVSQTVGDTMSMSGTGVETFHAQTLLGISGSLIDRTWQYLTGKEYTGEDIRLTIDAELTSYISGLFPEGKNGAVAVINYQTGEILSMVSKPDYDPQALVNRREGADENGSGYLNRCLQGQYAPGSVFKVITLAAALENLPNVQNEHFYCEAEQAFGDGTVSCYGHTKHGKLSLLQAFSESCNVSFAEIACALGSDLLAKTAEDAGFNDNFRFQDLILYESSMEKGDLPLYDLAWTGVGQGTTLVTPLHMAMIAGAVGAGGIMREPKLILQVTGEGGIPRIRTGGGIYRRAFSDSTARTLSDYMRYAVERGTGTKARISGYTVCGKTGSAEISNDKSVSTNAWFVGFVEDERHPYAIAAVVEQGGTGGSVAAPLAAKALKMAIERNG